MPEEASSSSGISPTGKSNGKKVWNVLLIVVVIIVIGLFVWSEQNRRNTSRQLAETTKQLEEVQNSSQQSSEREAAEVLEKVSSLINISLDPRPTVAKINDIDRLKEANEFFGSAENGDYLILTGSRAILYDPDKNIVLDVAPFQINRESPSPSPVTQNQQSTSQTSDTSGAGEE